MQFGLRIFALALLAAGATPAVADTSEFLTKAIKGANSESRLGALAVKRGNSAGVRQFGAMLVRDHSEARRQAVPVAMRHKVRVPDGMADEARTEHAKLQRLNGAALDREFARYMAEDHQKDISDFQTEVASGDAADVRALARQTLPELHRHLATARSLR